MRAKRLLWKYLLAGNWIALCSFVSLNQPAQAQTELVATVAPTIQSVGPAIGSTLGGTKVTITGTTLYLPQQVTFGGVPATVLSSGGTFIDVLTPPRAVGVVDVAVVNSGGFKATLTKGFTYTIAVTTSSLPDGIAGISYSQALAATGGVQPYLWSVVAGSLPPGLSLDAATGIVKGYPAANYSTFGFTVQAADSSPKPFTATATLSITVDIGLNPGPVPASFFGISAISPNDWPSITFGTFGKGSGVTWPYLEPEKGQFDWSRLDAYVANAKAHGVSIFWTNHQVPQWASGNPSTCTTPESVPVCTSSVANIADWDAFCAALVTRYKGRIQMYELWNEPDTYQFTGTTADMVELTQHFYNAIRADDPNALIASPSATNANWLSNYFGAGGPTGVDIVAVHGYLGASINQPENLATYKAIPWHPVMVQYGLQHLPIWDTEGSWGQNAVDPLDSDAQAAFLSRDYLLHWSAGITAFDWYSWDDPAWGTLSSNGVVSFAGTAYTQVYKWMTGAVMPQPCSITGNVYACTLTRANGYTALAVWDAGRVCTPGTGCPTTNYPAPPEFVQYRDLTGAVTRIQSGQVVLIGAKPILLENRNP